jgi:signal transduction histidine kinase
MPFLVVALIQVLGTTLAARHATPGSFRQLDVLGYALLMLGPAALLALRLGDPRPRSYPRTPPFVLVGALAPTVAYFALGYPLGPGFLAAILAIFAAVQAGWRQFTWAAVGVAYAAWGLLAWAFETAHAGQLVTVGVWSVVVVGFAEASRIRRERFAEMARARAEEQRSQEEQERRQASEERLRIAQELHDVIGHHLSLINVQAGVGLHLMDERPEQAREALAAIKHASSEALRETRAVLAALRPQEQSPPLAPTPGLADLASLVAEVRAAGLPVEVSIDGAGERSAAVDRAAYRIVQEALTNVRRHAGLGATATVTVWHTADGLTLQIVDDGAGDPAGDGAAEAGRPVGNGIVGMRERALALGGDVVAGPRPGGGFEVRVSLPLHGQGTT